MKKIFSATIIFIFIVSCSSDKPKVKLTIKEIASKNMATVGTIGRAYRADTSITLPSGEYVIINIVSVKKNNNTVVIENFTSIEQTKLFVKKIAYFVLIDEYGDSDSAIELSIQPVNDNTGIVLHSKNDINKFKYVAIGGIDSTINNNEPGIIFEIK